MLNMMIRHENEISSPTKQWQGNESIFEIKMHQRMMYLKPLYTLVKLRIWSDLIDILINPVHRPKPINILEEEYGCFDGTQLTIMDWKTVVALIYSTWFRLSCFRIDFTV